MNTKDTNRVNMIRTTNKYCDDNVLATEGIGAFAGVLATAKNKGVLIDSMNMVSISTSEGVTLDTELLGTTMINIAFKCASATFAWASSEKKNAVMAKVDYPRSKFDQLSKEDLDDACQSIHDETETNIAEVAFWGADATDVTDLQTAIDLFRQSMQDPRQFIIDRKDANRQIKQLIREIIDNQYKQQMDKMVNTLRYTNEEFYEKYYGAREIIDLGSTSTKIRGTVTDEAGMPLQGVAFILRLTGETEIAYEDSTNEDGEFNIAEVKPENYDIEASLAGYQSHTETDVHFSPGAELSRSIALQPEIIA